ncbi:MAG: MBOAT family O-acyltransferase, partial [Spirochaetota bacterium]
MVFSTTIFLFAFLPLFLAIYYLIPERQRYLWILAGSWFFYAWWRIDFLVLLVATTVWSYYLGRAIAKNRDQRRDRARRILVGAVVLNIGVLGYFKYANFGVDTLNALLDALGVPLLSISEVILPIGISFYTFQATSYVVDVYRGDAPAGRDYAQVAAYISLFPQLIAGPILRYKNLEGQLRERTHSHARFSHGAVRFMTGFCKKVLIADTVATLVDQVFATSEPGLIAGWLGAVGYTIQLYYDFTGYSDMAIGLGLMMGFRFIENFNRPYISKSITEFWRRWHISLSSWLRDYLYIPLGGNRKGRQRTYINIMLVMLLGGLWHGAAWTFVAWGAWHGLFLMGERVLEDRGHELRLPRALSVFLTMLVVVIGWVVFRAQSFPVALNVYAGMIGMNGLAVGDQLLWQISPLAVAALVIGIVLVYVEPYFSDIVRGHADRSAALPAAYTLAVVPLFAASVMKLSAESFSPF